MEVSKLPAPVSQYYYGAAELRVLLWSDSGGWSFVIANMDKKILRAAYMWQSKRLAIELACVCLLSMGKPSTMTLKETRYTYATNPELVVKSHGPKWLWKIKGKSQRLSRSKSLALAHACKELK